MGIKIIMDSSDTENSPEAEQLKNSDKMEAALKNELIVFIAIPIETEESLIKRFGFVTNTNFLI